MGHRQLPSISETAAQAQVTYATCIEILARDLAKLPILLYRNRGTGRERATTDSRYWLLKQQPNEMMTRVDWMLAMMAAAGYWGNGYSYIERTKMAKTPAALWPMAPQWTTPEVDSRGKLGFKWAPPGAKPQWLPAADVIHVKRFTQDGVNGISPISALRLTLAQQLQADEFAGKFYQNAAMLSGIVSVDGELSDQGRENLKKSFRQFYQGTENAFSILPLEAGSKFEKVAIPQKDAQFLESNRFRAEQIAAFMGVPMHRLNDLSRATYSNVQQNALDYLQNTLLFWAEVFTLELDRKVIGPGEDLYFEFNFESILQTDTVSRYDAYQKLVFAGGITSNEIRDRENLPAVEGGDTLLVPVNLQSLERAIAPPVSSPFSNPAPDPEPTDPAPSDATRSKRTASRKARLRVAISGADAIGDAIARVVRKEVAGLKPIVAAYDGTEQVQTLMEGYYTDEIIDRIRRDVAKVFSSVAKGVYAEVSEEMGREFLASEVSEFVESYASGYARAHAAESVKQLSALARDNWAPDDLRSALQERLSEWLERRADKEAERQSVQLSNKAAREGYRSAGVRTLVWRSNANCCPICAEMDGRVCGIESSFLEHDDEIRAEDGETAPFRARGDVFTPPLHGGCACSIEPGS